MKAKNHIGPALLVLAVFIILGSLYAVFTPIWQAPDEPAHYNYIRALALGEGFPIMEAGDWDQAYLSQLTSEGFPETLPVTSLEYEDHQPPLYYVLATPVYLLSNSSVIAIRLFSLLLGAVAISMVMLTTRELLPAQPLIAVFAGGLLAFIPQFVAICASINNDVLVYALLWLWLWLAMRYLRHATKAWVLGLVMGLLLLTKTTGYSVVILTGLLAVLRWRTTGESWQNQWREWIWLLLPAVILGALWWGRNSAVYGFPDVMGLQRHNAIVVGQPRTADWIASQGFVEFLKGAARTTFQSFWGQFGWMGVVLDARIYQGLAIYCLLLVVAILGWLIRALKQGISQELRQGLILMAALALITAGLFIYYNLTFVQHQGRYLFPGLPLLAVLSALGLSQVLKRRQAWITGVIFAGLSLLLVISGLVVGDFAVWVLLLCGAIALGTPLLSYFGERAPKLRPLLAAALLGGAVLLNLLCLFGFIIPILT